MSNWDLLGGNDGANSVEDNVEYVGIEEVDDVVQEPMNRTRQAVHRVTPPRHLRNGQPMYPVQQRNKGNGVVGGYNRDEEDLVSYVDMPFGKQLGLTTEALKMMEEAPMMDMDGQMAQRLEPGTYVMYGPSRAGAMGLGTETAPAASTYSEWEADSTPQRDTSWVGGLISGIAQLGAGIATAVVGGQNARREAATERLRIQAEAAASQSAREIAYREVQLEHEENLERIRAGTAELEELRRQQDEAAALRAAAPLAPPAVDDSSGLSTGTFVVIGLLGLGAVGGLVWFFGFRKKDEDGE